MIKDICDACYLNAKFLHKDLPFGCFAGYCSHTLDTAPKILDVESMKHVHKEWIDKHPNWKGVPHMVQWYYEEDTESFNRFLEKYPSKWHAPNSTWEHRYDVIVLE